MFHYLLAKIHFEPFHDFLKSRFPFGVGFRWAGGGAQVLWDYLCGDAKDRVFFCMDISGKDLSFTANDIAILLMTASWGFEFGDDPRSRICKTFLRWLVQNTAGHVLNFPGGLFNLVMGSLCSGDYNTSYLNTLHLVVVCCSYCVFCFEETNDIRYLTAMKTGLFRVVIQGDDIIGSISDSLPLMTPEHFRAFIKSHFAMNVKESAFRQARSLLIQVNKYGFLVTPEKERIVFLQRYFREFLVVRNGVSRRVLRPHRNTSDTIYKMRWNAQGMKDAYDCLCKWIGLALDTMGVNDVAWRLVVGSIDSLLKADVFGELGYEQESLIARLKDSKFVSERLYKMGLAEVDSSKYMLLAFDRQRLLDFTDGVNADPEYTFLHNMSVQDRGFEYSKY